MGKFRGAMIALLAVFSLALTSSAQSQSPTNITFQFKSNCQAGEKICYGGWVTGNAKLYWGVGPNGKLGCESCCYTCSNNMTPVINLNN